MRSLKYARELAVGLKGNSSEIMASFGVLKEDFRTLCPSGEI